MPGISNRQNLSPAIESHTRAARRKRVSVTQLLDQATFRNALVRERRQADRFETTFGLVLVLPRLQRSLTNHADGILQALRETGRNTDVYGWFEQGTVMGTVRWHKDGVESAAAVQAQVEHELQRCLGAAVDEYVVRAYVYSSELDSMATTLRDAVADQWRAGTFNQLSKRLLDIAGSSALLLASSPLFVACAVLVKTTSSGAVFFRQQRIGERGRPFMMLKFRTMHANAGHDLHQQYVSHFIQGDVYAEAGASAPVFKIVADPRITRVGHFLRRASLDELPQFWNVLRGDMSLVGPRPPLPYEVKVYKAWHRRRLLEAKPGITGLWQVTGRSRTTFDEMVRLDIRYARNQSLWTDLRILMATPRAVISGRGAL